MPSIILGNGCSWLSVALPHHPWEQANGPDSWTSGPRSSFWREVIQGSRSMPKCENTMLLPKMTLEGTSLWTEVRSLLLTLLSRREGKQQACSYQAENLRTTPERQRKHARYSEQQLPTDCRLTWKEGYAARNRYQHAMYWASRFESVLPGTSWRIQESPHAVFLLLSLSLSLSESLSLPSVSQCLLCQDPLQELMCVLKLACLHLSKELLWQLLSFFSLDWVVQQQEQKISESLHVRMTSGMAMDRAHLGAPALKTRIVVVKSVLRT